MEFCGPLILGVDHDGEYRERLGGTKDAAHRIRHQEIAEALAAHARVTCQSSDQRSRDTVVMAPQ